VAGCFVWRRRKKKLHAQLPPNVVPFDHLPDAAVHDLAGIARLNINEITLTTPPPDNRNQHVPVNSIAFSFRFSWPVTME
jgi:hypothetical protein